MKSANTDEIKIHPPAAEADFIKKKQHLSVGQMLFLFWRRHPESDRGIADLQSAALPLGYGAI